MFWRYVVLAGLPATTLAPLQRVQNAAARLVLGIDRRAHITPALRELHWLPVKFRIDFKVATMMHQILTNRCPAYMADQVEFCSSDAVRRRLRSTTSRAALKRRTRTQFGRRAFSVYGPDVWNDLPADIRTIDSHQRFRCALKSHLFYLAFSVWWLMFYIVVFSTLTRRSKDIWMHSRSICMTGHYNLMIVIVNVIVCLW